MKKINYWGVLAVVLTLTFAACGNRGTQSTELIGTWAWESSNWVYVFNEDGTGTRGTPDAKATFRWSNPDTGRLNIRLDNPQPGERRNEEWNYTITGGTTLAIESRQERGLRLSYSRVQ